MTYSRILAVLLATAGLAAAQQTADDTPASSTSLMSQFFDHDFVNVFAFGDGTFDTALPKLGAGGYTSALGVTLGGGITAGHQFRDAGLSFSYRGDYRKYFTNTYSNGTDQSANILYTKRLSRHWHMGVSASAGDVVYGGSFYSYSPGGVNTLTNPLSNQSRFASANLNLTYEQTRRLSYTFTGQFFLNSYSYAGAISSRGGSGNVAVNYRTTARTTIGGAYTHTYFSYGQTGDTSVDGAYLTVSHRFPSHWGVSLSGGMSHSHSQGVIREPVGFLLNQQLVAGFLVGPYNSIYNAPSFQVSVSRNIHHSLLDFSAGQGINAGNGTYLASKDQFGHATYSLTRHLTNMGIGAGYTRLTSIANTVSSQYSTATISASYGRTVARFVAANFRYDFIHYGSLYSLNGLNESRLSFGLSFSSRNIPLTLY